MQSIALVPSGSLWQENVWILILLLVSLITYVLADWAKNRSHYSIAENIAFDAKKQLFDHMLYQDLAFYHQHKKASLLNKLTYDTENLYEFYAYGFSDLLVSILCLLGIAGVLFVLDWALATIVFMPIPLILYLITTAESKVSPILKNVSQHREKMLDIANAALSGATVVKGFGKQQSESSKFTAQINAVRNLFLKSHATWSNRFSLTELLICISSILVWFLAFYLFASTANTLTVATFVTFLFYMALLPGHVRKIGQGIEMFSKSLVSLKNIDDILTVHPKIETKPAAKTLTNVESIAFNNVSFSYPPDALINLSFSIKRGQKVGIIGASGSGKSTIASLLCRFYDATSGQVLVNQQNIQQFYLKDLRKKIGLVPQEPFLFSGSIKDNLTYGRQASQHDIVAAAKIACIHDFIMSLPNGYDSTIEEQGANFSGGQKQRLCLARALVANFDVLILDEPTAALDSVTEGTLFDNLNAHLSNVTLIVITHQPRLLSGFDVTLDLNQPDQMQIPA